MFTKRFAFDKKVQLFHETASVKTLPSALTQTAPVSSRLNQAVCILIYQESSG